MFQVLFSDSEHNRLLCLSDFWAEFSLGFLRRIFLPDFCGLFKSVFPFFSGIFRVNLLKCKNFLNHKQALPCYGAVILFILLHFNSIQKISPQVRPAAASFCVFCYCIAFRAVWVGVLYLTVTLQIPLRQTKKHYRSSAVSSKVTF